MAIFRFYYFRHCESWLNKKKRITGQLNPLLTYRGRRDASSFAHAFAELHRRVGFAAICCGPMYRTLHTAQLMNRIARVPIHVI